MNSKISSLVISAHNDLGMDNQLKVKDCDIDADVFYTDSIFLPAVVIITNALYFRATQDTLIKLNGGVRKSTVAPFGLRLDGDIDLSNTEKPLGYIEQCIKTTLRVIQPMYKNDLLENFSLHLLHEVIHEFEDNDEIPDKMYMKQDLLLGTV